jgi:hypothetical protein
MRLLSSTCRVSPSAGISAASSVRISVKFDIADFYENLSRKFQVWLKSGKNIGHFALFLQAKLNHHKALS